MKNIEEIARLCHEVNRAFCISNGDDSYLSWEETPPEIKESVMSGVEFLLEVPDATPEELHDKWWFDKIQDGWKLGPEKSLEKKTHPCMRPYDELPLFQRSKDYIFLAVVQNYK